MLILGVITFSLMIISSTSISFTNWDGTSGKKVSLVAQYSGTPYHVEWRSGNRWNIDASYIAADISFKINKETINNVDYYSFKSLKSGDYITQNAQCDPDAKDYKGNTNHCSSTIPRHSCGNVKANVFSGDNSRWILSGSSGAYKFENAVYNNCYLRWRDPANNWLRASTDKFLTQPTCCDGHIEFGIKCILEDGETTCQTVAEVAGLQGAPLPFPKRKGKGKRKGRNPKSDFFAAILADNKNVIDDFGHENMDKDVYISIGFSDGTIDSIWALIIIVCLIVIVVLIAYCYCKQNDNKTSIQY